MILDQLNHLCSQQGLSISFRQHNTADETIFYPMTNNFVVDESTWKRLLKSNNIAVTLVKNNRTEPFCYPTGQCRPPYYFRKIEGPVQPTRTSLALRAVVLFILCVLAVFVALIKKPV